ncbi:triphosphoribosyl-dephospho-CoA synthase CitG [Furfurilactobacillus curtus]|uniref:Probable 2-(5''-triphosphoribosyl)-3'-dephosphocoenzyme-A synthase n=1 Tax=Furfurilactobacillus curtus TaxID=1746200 RepID=A0ABQ5JKN2_9LACO
MTAELNERQQQIERLGQLAVQALMMEVTVNPKPGLVDPVNQGPHPDMDVFTFITSAMSLQSYFNQAARLGSQAGLQAGPTLFGQLRAIGKKAETSMFTATHGVNTHKGAIFSLGIIVTAAGATIDVDSNLRSNQIFDIAKQMLTGVLKSDFTNLSHRDPESLTAGERQFLKYGKTGIRGEATAGFPTVRELALPFLRQTTGTTMDRLLDTLIKIAGETSDSNLIKRAGTPAITQWMKEQSRQYFARGGSKTTAGQAFLHDLNQVFLERGLSLGGSADLLILTIYFGLLEDLF